MPVRSGPDSCREEMGSGTPPARWRDGVPRGLPARHPGIRGPVPDREQEEGGHRYPLLRETSRPAGSKTRTWTSCQVPAHVIRGYFQESPGNSKGCSWERGFCGGGWGSVMRTRVVRPQQDPLSVTLAHSLTHGVVVTAGAGGWVPPRGSASPPFLSALSMGKWLGHPAHNVSPTHKIQQYPHPPLLH